MPATIEQLIPVRNVVEFDGSNAQDIIDAMHPGAVSGFSITLVSQSEGVAEFGYDDAGPQTLTAHVGDFIAVVDYGPLQIIPGDMVPTRFVKVSALT